MAEAKQTAKALLLDKPGTPLTLRVGTIAIPQPAEDELLVRVHAAGLNPVDWKVGSACFPAGWKAFPVVLGLDAAGVVESMGAQVQAEGRFIRGDRVFFHGNLNRQVGALAEFTTTRALGVAKIPDRMTFVQAAALPCAALTAYQCVVRKMHLGVGKTVLIHAAAGGVGCFAAQLAKHMGATVIGTCSARSEKFLKTLGVDYTVDYRSDVYAAVRKITGGLGVDAILQAADPAMTACDLELLAFGGELVCIVGDILLDPIKHRPFERALSVAYVFLGGAYNAKAVHRSNEYHLRDFVTMSDALGALWEAGKLKIPVEHVVKLEEVPATFEAMRDRKLAGKAVAVLKED